MIIINSPTFYGAKEAIRGMRNSYNSWGKSDSKTVHVIFTIFFGIMFFVSAYQVTMSESTSFADDPMWSICAIVSGIYFLIYLISPSIDDHYL